MSDKPATLDVLIESVLNSHVVDHWLGEDLLENSWVICKCNEVSHESEHFTHVARIISEAVESNKHLVIDLPDPEEHATTSRDYGRGFAEALRLVQQATGRNT